MRSRIEKLRRTYFRDDNSDVWRPIFLSLIGYLLSTVSSAILTSSPVWFWILFIASVICCGLFIYFSYRYVEKWHGIISMLRKKDEALVNTCAFLAVMEKTKHINQCIKVSDVTITYKFSESQMIGTCQYYPFHLSYKVSGVVQQAFTRLYFHVLNYKQDKIYDSIGISFGKVKGSKTLAENYGASHKFFEPFEIQRGTPGKLYYKHGL